MLASVMMFHAKDVAWLATEDDRKHEPSEVYRIPLYDPSPTLHYGPYGTTMLLLSLGFLIGNFRGEDAPRSARRALDALRHPDVVAISCGRWELGVGS